ncbi:rod shape-determining protein [Miniphocaeibacter halophilus]|uniref:Rod shape-determining protein n=1 Tax=Miniphocaeibacter halophilus TaxID=2931922 RepID=A0AC61MPE8_9FIRM|nr:rod shape-determining protein [Miniphocaeibacter halophilus]QQK07392.1 rod shape-determining protein [Miniphocaeibacter halophilus]
MANLRRSIAIDLGTASVLVYMRGKGVIINEPSVVAMDSYTGKVLSVGKEAKKMLGRTPGNIIATRPMKDGVIADFNTTEKMLSYFIEKALGKSFIKPNVVICVPSEITQVQRRAVIQASKFAGAYKTYLIEEPLAAAIGAGVDIGDAGGNMIIDIGGGTTDVAVIALGGIIINRSIPIAGDECDKAISNYIKKKYNMIIGERTAEDIKINIATANLKDDNDLFEVRGRNLINGLPMHVFVTASDISEALEKPLAQIVDTVHSVLEQTPPELAADLFERGAIMTGGSSLISGLDKKIQEKIGIKVQVAEGPVTAVVRGTGKALNWIDKLDSSEMGEESSRKKAIEERMKNNFNY